MITKIKFTLVSIFALAVSFIPFATAKAQESLIFGQKHAYSVFVKSNKEAFVFARLALTNPDESPLTKSSFTLSNAKASEMSVYQVVLPQDCAQYDYRSGSNKCVRYKEPSYTQDYSYYGSGHGDTKNIEYHKVTYQESGGKYSFDLPKTVEPHKSTAIIVIYATKDYISNSFGRYTFNFETLAVEQRITEANVAVTAETDFQLKNPDKSYDYPYYGGLESGANLSANSAQTSFTNPDIDKLVYSIGGRGQLNKTFNSITPNETVSVKGMFANSWFKLYLFEVLMTILGLGGFFALLIFLSKKYGGRIRQTTQTSTVNSQSVQNRFTLLVPLYWIASFVSALLVGGLTLAITALDKNNALDFLDNASPIVEVFTVLIAIIVYLFAVIGPAISVGTRYKWKAAVTVIILQFIWYIAAALLLVSLSN
ncbi:hypothetical protein IT415_01035 [bacterium]|nr:hypothetical protein [bacterium]